jgi:hypothetical protein
MDQGMSCSLPGIALGWTISRDANVVLEAMGLEIETPPVGCCGHAGSFGYEAEHHPRPCRSPSSLCCRCPQDAFRPARHRRWVQLSSADPRWYRPLGHGTRPRSSRSRSSLQHPYVVPKRRYLEPAATPPKYSSRHYGSRARNRARSAGVAYRLSRPHSLISASRQLSCAKLTARAWRGARFVLVKRDS